MRLAKLRSKLTTATLLSALAVVPIGTGAVLMTLPAAAQTAQPPAPPPPPPPAPDKAQGPGPHHPGPPMMRHGMDHGGWMHQAWKDHDGWGRRHHHRQGDLQMRLAGKLAAVETAIGIRSDQLDAWRDFTSKLVMFVSPPWQRGGPDMDRHAGGPDPAAPPTPPVNAGNAEGDATPPPMPPATADDQDKDFGMLGRIVDGAIARGDEARALKDSMEKLKSVLTPEQIQEARMLMRQESMRMRHGWGHHGWHHRHHRWGDDDAAGPGGPGNPPDPDQGPDQDQP